VQVLCTILQMHDGLFINPPLRETLIYTKRVMFCIAGESHSET
jgi:hypothetical protein